MGGSNPISDALGGIVDVATDITSGIGLTNKKRKKGNNINRDKIFKEEEVDLGPTPKEIAEGEAKEDVAEESEARKNIEAVPESRVATREGQSNTLEGARKRRRSRSLDLLDSDTKSGQGSVSRRTLLGF